MLLLRCPRPLCPCSANFGGDWPDVGANLRNSGHVACIVLPRFAGIWPDSVRNATSFERTWPCVDQPDSHQIWGNLANIGPTLVKLRPKLTNLGRSCSECGHIGADRACWQQELAIPPGLRSTSHHPRSTSDRCSQTRAALLQMRPSLSKCVGGASGRRETGSSRRRSIPIKRRSGPDRVAEYLCTVVTPCALARRDPEKGRRR